MPTVQVEIRPATAATSAPNLRGAAWRWFDDMATVPWDLWTALPQLVKNEMEEDEKYLGYVARTYAKRYIRHNGAKPHMWNPNHKNAEKEGE